MNRKMTLFAFAGSLGDLDASGLLIFGASEAAEARCRNPSLVKSELSAAAPKPQPVSQRNSRRVRRQKLRPAELGFMCSSAILYWVRRAHAVFKPLNAKVEAVFFNQCTCTLTNSIRSSTTAAEP